MTDPSRPDPTADSLINAKADASVIAAGLELAGWRLAAVEIDTVANTGRVELVSFAGRVVTLDVRHGKGTVTREQREVRTTTVGRRGDRAPVVRIVHTFLGRSRVDGVRSGLRVVANYIEDNAPDGRLTRGAARVLLAPLLSMETSHV